MNIQFSAFNIFQFEPSVKQWILDEERTSKRNENIRRFEICQTCKTVAEEVVSLRIEIQSHTWWNPLRQREHDVTCVASAFQKHRPSISTGFVLWLMQTLQTCIPKNVSSPSPTRDFTSVPAFLLL